MQAPHALPEHTAAIADTTKGKQRAYHPAVLVAQ
jgi:hypothetical protein